MAQAVAQPMQGGVAMAQPAAPPGQAAFFSAQQSALQQWFAMVDADRSGAISATELQKALAQGGLNFSLKMVASIIRTQSAEGVAQLGVGPTTPCVRPRERGSSPSLALHRLSPLLSSPAVPHADTAGE